MPRFNVSKKVQSKYERCLKDVRKKSCKGKKCKVNPFAVCYVTVIKPHRKGGK